MKNLLLLPLTLLALCLLNNGCFTAETTTINTPALFVITNTPAGLQTNQVSVASITTTVRKELLFLPKDYAVTHKSTIYGVQVAATDTSTGTPKVQLGIVNDLWTWVPSDTNQLYSPALTLTGHINNKAIPFWWDGDDSFTSGNTYTSQSDTNSVTTAITPAPALPK